MVETKSTDGNYGCTREVGEVNEPRLGGGVVQALGGSRESCG